MTTPDVPHRIDLRFEVPGTPEQVWDAVATANGISAWFLPTDLEEREGGAVTFHMGPDASSSGEVTGWQPPSRFAYEEAGWGALSGHPEDAVTPLVTEFLVEATSGGTCSVRVVSSAFGTGAEWEREVFEEMERGWKPFFANMRLYLSEFPGQRVTSLSSSADVTGGIDPVWGALRRALGAEAAGRAVEVRGVTGRVERLADPQPPHELLVRLTDPVPGFLQFHGWDKGDGTSNVGIEGYLFSPDAAAYVEREQPAWSAWLADLTVPTP
jgi:uncharacterized protein YndB with AHSA1/START domain